MAVATKVYCGQFAKGNYLVGCIDDRGYVYKNDHASTNASYIVGCVDNNGRIYNGKSARGNYLVGCSDNRGNIYRNNHASTSAAYLVGNVVSKGNLGRVYKKTSSAVVATIEGGNHVAGAMAYLLLLSTSNGGNLFDLLASMFQ
ncbi:hypothetical protein LJB76_01590 [Clostridia bacterium OttesenSCG-928-O13]|nr:hypothetical protein [Clostridia bacterium OttesenSCG-928-O13]